MARIALTTSNWPSMAAQNTFMPGAVLEQKIRDLLVAHMSGPLQGGFKISAAPIPAGVEELRFLA